MLAPSHLEVIANLLSRRVQRSLIAPKCHRSSAKQLPEKAARRWESGHFAPVSEKGVGTTLIRCCCSFR